MIGAAASQLLQYINRNNKITKGGRAAARAHLSHSLSVCMLCIPNMHNTLTRRRQVRAIFILRECAASSPSRHRRAGEWLLLLTTANLLTFSFKRTQNLLPGERVKKMSMSGAIRRAIKVAAGVDWSIQGHQGLASLSSRKRSLMLFLACDHYTRGINVKSYYTHYHACACGLGWFVWESARRRTQWWHLLH